MESNDKQQNGPEEQPMEPAEERPAAEQPTAEQGGPQAPAGEAPTAPPRRRLSRSRDDRVVAGVCGGIARYFNIDPVFVRIGAVALAFVGGAGLLLYLAALLLMPSDEGGAVVEASGDRRNRALVIAGVVGLLFVAWPFLLGGGFLLAGIGIPLALLVGTGVLVWWLVSGEGPSGDPGQIARRAALGIGVLVLCWIVFVGGALLAAGGPDWLVPASVIAAGAAILAGAFLKPVRWLVLPAIALGMAAGLVGAAGIDTDGGMGEREYRPASTVDLRDRYELGIGDLEIDLRQTDLPGGDVPLEVDLGIGEARVLVPDDVCVATTADIGAGNVETFGRDTGGVDVDFEEYADASPATTRLLVDADIGLGALRVMESDGLHPGDNSACDPTGERASG